MSEQPRNVVPEPLRVQPSHIDYITSWRSELTGVLHTTIYFEFAKHNEYVCSCGDVSRDSVNNWMIDDTRTAQSEVKRIESWVGLSPNRNHTQVILNDDTSYCSCGATIDAEGNYSG